MYSEILTGEISPDFRTKFRPIRDLIYFSEQKLIHFGSEIGQWGTSIQVENRGDISLQNQTPKNKVWFWRRYLLHSELKNCLLIGWFQNQSGIASILKKQIRYLIGQNLVLNSGEISLGRKSEYFYPDPY